MRTMYDTTEPALVPADAQAIGYYPYAWNADLSHLKAAIEVRIVNMVDHLLHADDCHAIDVENGAASIQDAVNFVDQWNHLHPSGMHTGNGWIRLPIVYISESRVGELRAAMGSRKFDLWVAWWGVGPTTIPGAFAHQYTDRGPHGENYDISVITDDTWGIVPAPPAPPVPPVPPVTAVNGMVVWMDSVHGLMSRVVSTTDRGAHWS